MSGPTGKALRVIPGGGICFRRISCLWAVAALGLVAVLPGCGGSDLVEVSGSVTRQGKPLPGLFVKFESEQGEPGWATTDQQGRYTLRSAGGKRGVIPGTYRVWVAYRPIEPDPATGTLSPPEGIEQVEAKYGAKASQLRLEITGSGGDVDLTLD